MGSRLDLRAVHALRAGQNVQQRIVRIRLARIELGGLKNGRAQRQAVVRKIPLGADFVGPVLLRRQVGGAGAQRKRFGGRIERSAGGEVDAADGNRLVDCSGAPARHFVDAVESCCRGDGLRVVRVETVPAEAAGEIPMLADLHGVEHVSGGGNRCRVHDGSDRRGAGERLIRIRIEQAGGGNVGPGGPCRVGGLAPRFDAGDQIVANEAR